MSANPVLSNVAAAEGKSTACILCECNCGIEVQLGGEDGRRLVKVRGDDAHPASQGYACEKAHRVDFYQNGPHRLTRPLRRRDDGSFEEIDWDTAITEVAARLAEVLCHFASLPIAQYCQACGVHENLVRRTARRIASASSVASFEDLGVQMNRHSTLVSYLHKLLVLLTGNFGKEGSAFAPTPFMSLANGYEGGAGNTTRTPATGSRVIGGLTPCNVIPDEILTDHPKRFCAMLVESGNPAHSLADSPRMREALAALDLVVVIDAAFTETARLAHYVLPGASQFEKAQATFFNFEFPHNYFHRRKALLPPLPGLFSEAELHARLLEALGALPTESVAALRAAWKEGRKSFREQFFTLATTDPRTISLAPVLLYRAIGNLLPEGLAEGAGVWALCQIAAQRQGASLARAGFTGEPGEAGDALFDALLASKSAVVFAVDTWEECFERLRTPNHRVQPAIPELFEELDGLATASPSLTTPEFPFLLSAGERRSFTANTIMRNPEWRKKDRGGALRMNPQDAERIGVTDGARAANLQARQCRGVGGSVGPHAERAHRATERARPGLPRH